MHYPAFYGRKAKKVKLDNGISETFIAKWYIMDFNANIWQKQGLKLILILILILIIF